MHYGEQNLTASIPGTCPILMRSEGLSLNNSICYRCSSLHGLNIPPAMVYLMLCLSLASVLHLKSIFIFIFPLINFVRYVGGLPILQICDLTSVFWLHTPIGKDFLIHPSNAVCLFICELQMRLPNGLYLEV